MDFEQSAILIVSSALFYSLKLSLLLTNFVIIVIRKNVYVSIKTCCLVLSHIIRIHPDDVCNSGCRRQIRCIIRNQKIVSGNKLGNSPVEHVVKVHFLKCTAGQRQIEEKSIHLRVVLVHNVHDLEVHKLLNTLRLHLYVRSRGANDLSSYRARRR